MMVHATVYRSGFVVRRALLGIVCSLEVAEAP